MALWSIIGIISVIIVAARFTRQLGKSFPILELMILVAGLQWIVGPLIEYASPSTHFKYYMYVSQTVYMSYVVPAYAIFASVILIGIKQFSDLKLRIEDLKYYEKQGLIILFIGIFFDFFGSNLPGALGFVAFILSNFKYVGAIILYYSERKKYRSFFYFVLLYLLFISISRALFHDFILWSVFFYMVWAQRFKPSFTTKLTTFAIAGFMLVTLQTVKSVYRSEVWGGYSGNKLELFLGLMSNAFLIEETASEFDDETDSNVRLNQGWIISAVMDQIPRANDFYDGETIVDAFSAAVLPRFLSPDKAKAGGQENFKKFTGLSLGEGTSMGISIVGEAYGNFGRFGGVIFMGLWSLILLRIYAFLLKFSVSNTLLIAFLPLIFLQVVKAETELVVVLNHLVKSSIIVFGFLWLAKRSLALKIENA